MEDIKEIKQILHEIEINGERLPSFKYLLDIWKRSSKSAELCVLIIDEMCMLVDDYEEFLTPPEEYYEREKYVSFLQCALIHALKHHNNDKMFLWRMCYYIIGWSTYHFLYKGILPIQGLYDEQIYKKWFFHKAAVLYPDSQLFRCIPAIQDRELRQSIMAGIDRKKLLLEIEEFHFGPNYCDQDFEDSITSLLEEPGKDCH